MDEKINYILPLRTLYGTNSLAFIFAHHAISTPYLQYA